jgi:hypothetical protein
MWSKNLGWKDAHWDQIYAKSVSIFAYGPNVVRSGNNSNVVRDAVWSGIYH